MKNIYDHTQIGYLIIVVILGIIVFLAGMVMIIPVHYAEYAVVIAVITVLFFFSSLKVRIDEDRIHVIYGIGLIRFRFRVNDVESCSVVNNPWYYGWGIRLTPHGWLFNVSGFHAVQIEMRTGKKYRIGTDEPDKLARTINQSIGNHTPADHQKI